MLNFYEVKKNRTHRTLHFFLIKPDCPVQNRTPGNPTHNAFNPIIFSVSIWHTQRNTFKFAVVIKIVVVKSPIVQNYDR